MACGSRFCRRTDRNRHILSLHSGGTSRNIL
jgi:hypothetical protein